MGMIGGTEDDRAQPRLAPPRAIENDSDDPPPRTAKPTEADRGGMIEIELTNGSRIRVGGFVNERTLCRVLRALKSLG
jgi:hypothetical protein